MSNKNMSEAQMRHKTYEEFKRNILNNEYEDAYYSLVEHIKHRRVGYDDYKVRAYILLLKRIIPNVCDLSILESENVSKFSFDSASCDNLHMKVFYYITQNMVIDALKTINDANVDFETLNILKSILENIISRNEKKSKKYYLDGVDYLCEHKYAKAYISFNLSVDNCSDDNLRNNTELLIKLMNVYFDIKTSGKVLDERAISNSNQGNVIKDFNEHLRNAEYIAAYSLSQEVLKTGKSQSVQAIVNILYAINYENELNKKYGYSATRAVQTYEELVDEFSFMLSFFNEKYLGIINNINARLLEIKNENGINYYYNKKVSEIIETIYRHQLLDFNDFESFNYSSNLEEKMLDALDCGDYYTAAVTSKDMDIRKLRIIDKRYAHLLKKVLTKLYSSIKDNNKYSKYINLDTYEEVLEEFQRKIENDDYDGAIIFCIQNQLFDYLEDLIKIDVVSTNYCKTL